MATNKVLIAQAIAIAAVLSISAETEDLNNAQLTALVKELKAKATDAGVAIDDAMLKADTVVKVKKPPYFVNEGKALTSKRGILAEGDEIKADDLAGGKEALDAFVKSGHVGKA